MADLVIYVKPDNGTRQRITAPGDMRVDEFLKDLLEGLNLVTGNGYAATMDAARSTNWQDVAT
jgi:hypothetical protein